MSPPGSKSRTTTPSAFEQQREELVREIAVGMEQVLQNINQLNRNLESIITVGNEFGSVEALWSQFENFMGRPDDENGNGDGKANEGHEADDKHRGQDEEEGESAFMKER